MQQSLFVSIMIIVLSVSFNLYGVSFVRWDITYKQIKKYLTIIDLKKTINETEITYYETIKDIQYLNYKSLILFLKYPKDPGKYNINITFTFSSFW